MFRESQVKAILQRAIELDAAKGGELTREELLTVAAEVGVSRRSMEQALTEEYALRHSPPQQGLRQVRLSVLRLLSLSTAIGVVDALLSSAAFSGAVLSNPIGSTVVATLCFGTLMMISGGLALSDSTKSLRNYVQENATVWVGFAFGGVLAAEVIARFGTFAWHSDWVSMSALITGLIGFGITSVVGSMLLAMRRPLPVDASGPPSTGLGVEPSVLTRMATAVRRWYGSVMERRAGEAYSANSPAS